MKPEDIDPEKAQAIVADFASTIEKPTSIMQERILAAVKPKGPWPMALGAKRDPYNIRPGKWEPDGRPPGGSGTYDPGWPGWDIGQWFDGRHTAHSQVPNEEMDRFLVEALKHRGVDVRNLRRGMLECERAEAGYAGTCTDPDSIPKGEDPSWCSSCTENEETLGNVKALEAVLKNAVVL